MSEDDRTPTTTTTQIVERPDRPLVENDRRARHHALQIAAYHRCADRGMIVFVASLFVVAGTTYSPWFAIAYVALVCSGYLWARAPMQEFERAVKRGLP